MTSEIQPVQDDVPAYRPRDYQVEMLDACMKENTIVVMDTGTGKTDIAVLRIKKELEICSPEKLIWFLTPTVELCYQQRRVITFHIPSVGVRLLTGLENVDCWSEQYIWDAALKDIQIVLSTPDVLYDALCHGFVNFSRLALIVFDEAHHCRRRHTTKKIMDNFYHPMKRDGLDGLPSILGLTASPVMGSNPRELREIEMSLDSRCRSPSIHRHELLEHTNRPVLRRICYEPLCIWGHDVLSRPLTALFDLWRRIDIESDPYVKKLRMEPHIADKLQEVLLTRKTYCNDTLKILIGRACLVLEDLGEWAANYLIHATMEQLKSAASNYEPGDLTAEELNYLIEFLSRVPLQDFTDAEVIPVSPKLGSLIAFLKDVDASNVSGLIFTKQRIEVGIMAKILSIHPETRDRFRCAPYVGLSSNPSRKGLVNELHDVKAQRYTLEEFRDGRINLIITTDVLEEGIDVSACNMVICYDKPPNLKSFIQRRGRARQKNSTYAIMFSMDDKSVDFKYWEDLEKVVMETYQHEESNLSELWEIEMVNEHVKEELLVESTGARLTAEDAVKHLHHFCSVLPKQPDGDSDTRPVFSFERGDDGGHFLRGIVALPNCVVPSVRRARGKCFWLTERAAKEDAAFQAYKSLYEAGLLNENLLPLTRKQGNGINKSVDLPAVLEAQEQWDPWVEMAHAWLPFPDLHQALITVRLNGVVNEDLSMIMTVPIPLPMPGPIELFWDNETKFKVSFDAVPSGLGMTLKEINDMREITSLYLRAPCSRRPYRENDFVTLFSPRLPPSQLEAWLAMNEGSYSVSEVFLSGILPLSMGLVRDHGHHDEPYIFQKWNVAQCDHMPSELQIVCRALPRRRNLLHCQTLADNNHNGDFEEYKGPFSSNRIRIVSSETSSIGKLPAIKAMFGFFIPIINDLLEKTLIAARLRDTILKEVGFSGISHVITAISAPSAHNLTDYQQYEFFGDSVLKFTVSYQLFLKNPTWHEGYLTDGRDVIVQNMRLALAAVETGLDAYVITNRFTPRKWRAPLISEKKDVIPKKRPLSRKVLADVVEALIGAAYVEGGQTMARTCIHVFLPEVSPRIPDFATVLRPSSNAKIPNVDEQLKQKIGYAFRNEHLLVEALTHSSCDFDAHTQSYQRLEFLGDAVLDMVIVSAMTQYSTWKISPGDMTKLKHALVNANLLAFLCMEFSVLKERTKTSVLRSQMKTESGAEIYADAESKRATPTPTIVQETEQEELALWCFMRFQGQQLGTSRDATRKRHSDLREDIRFALHNSNAFPWGLLTRLGPEKLFSDLIESVLGAIFVDSGGDLDECGRFVERIGLLCLLDRFLRHKVEVAHPGNVLQQLAKSEKVKYHCFLSTGQQDTNQRDMEGGFYSCSVSIGGTELASVSGCLNKDEAEIKAAFVAVRTLREQAFSAVEVKPPSDGDGDDDGDGDGGDDEENENESDVGSDSMEISTDSVDSTEMDLDD